MTSRLAKHVRPLTIRDGSESHRAATQLELMFDLVVVIALATAAHELRHAISADHVGSGVIQFGIAFFLLWWPWNLFTWFASSFDNDDALYRINVMIMMIGAIVIAASLPSFFEHQDSRLTFVGYVILRLASAALWWRAGRANPGYRGTAIKFTAGMVMLQIGWAIAVFTTEPGSVGFYAFFALGFFAELFVPWYAQHENTTPVHRHHVIERFGLLNIIVLGEVLLGSTESLEVAAASGFHTSTIVVALCGALIAFSMWWLYFAEEDHLESLDLKRVFVWGYGHFIVFAAGAAVGAGIGVALDAVSGHGQNGASVVAGLSVSIPISLYIFGLWLVRDRYAIKDGHGWILLGFAVLIALSGLFPYAPVPATVLLLACLIVRLQSERSKRA